MNKLKSGLEKFLRQCKEYFKNDFKSDLKELGSTVGSQLWTAMMASCIASTIARAVDKALPAVLLATWPIVWVILRRIRRFTARNLEIFAGKITINDFQVAATLIIDGVLACFILGRKISTGDNIASSIVLIVFGALEAIMLLTDLLCAIKRNYANAQEAIAILTEISNGLTDEEVTDIKIVAKCDDGTKKVFNWVPAKDAKE